MKKKKEECIVKDCHEKQFWAKYCEKHYNEEFDENRKGLVERFGLK